ncbi:MAG: YWFCY domain-containing protein [Bacteroidota bacterium]|nr:YWFCY domain-containing protein [Bacteroidota bacterium]
MNQTTTNGINWDPVLSMTRNIGILLLIIHFYLQDYSAFDEWGLRSSITDQWVLGFLTRIFQGSYFIPKLGAFIAVSISLFGVRGRKEPAYSPRVGFGFMAIGSLLYFTSIFIHDLPFPAPHIAIAYILLCGAGFLMIMHGANYLSRIIWNRQKTDVFNRLHESFPQEERLVSNKYSVHFPAIYEFKGKLRTSSINLVNLFRGTLLVGNPGSMKTVGFVEPLIRQLIGKGFSLVIHDLKSPKLSQLANYHFIRSRHLYPAGAAFHYINFYDLDRSHRANALPPSMLKDISDATESARTILFGLNKEWLEKPGDFFVESAINFVTALIWFLRVFEEGKYCSWPHVIELSATPLAQLLPILQAQPDLQAYVNPFAEARELGASDQLGGQVASAKIGFARLSSPAIYYVLTGDDFTLDINNPQAPKVLTLANNPQKANTYGAILSLYMNTINRMANRANMNPMGLILEECSSLFISSLEPTLATGRENLIAVFMVIQDLSQLRLTYGRKYADVLFNICGNIISGQTSGDTAEELSKRFGRIQQPRESLSINASDTSITQSHQLDAAIPPSRIATLSSGDFVGIVADNPDQRLELKAFSARLIVDFKALNREKEQYEELPTVRQVSKEEVLAVSRQIRMDVEYIVAAETARIANSPELGHLGAGWEEPA